jgi:hypothetical protein
VKTRLVFAGENPFSFASRDTFLRLSIQILIAASFLMGFVASGPSVAFAWPQGGVTITPTATLPWDPVAINNDGDGGGVVIWSATSSGSRNIYGARISERGNELWRVNIGGTGTGNEVNPQLQTDQWGRFFAMWDATDEPGSSGIPSVYIGQIDKDSGSTSPPKKVVQINATKTPALLVTSGGMIGATAYAVWVDNRYQGQNRLYVQSSAIPFGNSTWPNMNGILVSGASDVVTPPFAAAPNSTGDGLYVAWTDAGQHKVHVQWIKADGTLAWGTPIIVTSDEQFPEGYPVLTSDGVGGVFVAWQVQKPTGAGAPPAIDVRLTRLDEDGDACHDNDTGETWTISGTVCAANQTSVDQLQMQEVKSQDGTNVTFLTWFRENQVIKAQIIQNATPLHSSPIGENGISLITNVDPNTTFHLLKSADRAVVTWTYSDQAYAQLFDGDGVQGWPAPASPDMGVGGARLSFCSDGRGGVLWAGAVSHVFPLPPSDINIDKKMYFGPGVPSYDYDFWVNGVEPNSPGAVAYVYLSPSSQAGHEPVKPVIISEGFDDLDNTNWPELYRAAAGLVEALRQQGCDIIMVNYDDPYRKIEDNAVALEHVITQVNGNKIGSNKNVVIGASLGGVIARYALVDMEQNGPDHQARLYISLDSPHEGANLPLGLSFAISGLMQISDGKIDQPILHDLVRAINADSAREILLLHPVASDIENSTYIDPQPDPKFVAFHALLQSMGFPHETWNVGIANGAPGVAQSSPPGSVLFHAERSQDQLIYLIGRHDQNPLPNFPFFALKYLPIEIPLGHASGSVILNVWSSPGAATVDNDVVLISFLGQFGEFYQTDYWQKQINPGLHFPLYDNAPGSTFNFPGFPGVTYNKFCFVPALSALGVASSDMMKVPTRQEIPFDDYYYPSENQGHVSLEDPAMQAKLLGLIIGEFRVHGTITVPQPGAYEFRAISSSGSIVLVKDIHAETPVGGAFSGSYSFVLPCNFSGQVKIVPADYVDVVSPQQYAVTGSINGNVQADFVLSHTVTSWSPGGVALREGSFGYDGASICSDGSGGAMAAWGETDGSGSKVRVSRVNAAGDRGNGPSGMWYGPRFLHSGSEAVQFSPKVISDGVDGAVAVWNERPSTPGSPSDIYAARAGASVMFDPVQVTTLPADQKNGQVITDGAGGIYVAWCDTRSGSYHPYLQRVGHDHLAGYENPPSNGWPASDGIVLTQSSSIDQVNFRLCSDGNGGALACWTQATGISLYAQRVDGLATTYWTPNGVTPSSASATFESPDICPAGDGGAFITWAQNGDIYLQRIGPNGNRDAQWPTNGYAVCSDPGLQAYPRVISDASGYANVVWSDSRGGIYGERVYDGGGSPISLWTTNGSRLVADQPVPQLAQPGETIRIGSNGSSGFVIGWASDNGKFGVQRVALNGIGQWNQLGQIQVAPSDAYLPQLIGDGSAAALIAWASDDKVAISRIADDFKPPVVSNAAAYADSLPGGGYANAQYFDYQNQFVASWTTNVPTNSTIEYRKVQTPPAAWTTYTRQPVTSGTSHYVKVPVDPNSTYQARVITGEDGWSSVGPNRKTHTKPAVVTILPGTPPNPPVQIDGYIEPDANGVARAHELFTFNTDATAACAINIRKHQSPAVKFSKAEYYDPATHDPAHEHEITQIYSTATNPTLSYLQFHTDYDAVVTVWNANQAWPQDAGQENAPTDSTVTQCPDGYNNRSTTTWYIRFTTPTKEGSGSHYEFTVAGENEALVTENALFSNNPNPFASSTGIRFAVKEDSRVRLDIFDLQGRVVRTLANEPMARGLHELSWDRRSTNGERVNSGIYFYRLAIGQFIDTKKMVVLR